MRIGLIHHQFNPTGGMESYLFNLVEGFSEYQDQTTVFIYKKPVPGYDASCKIEKQNLSWLPRKWRKFWFGAFVYKNKELIKQNYKISLIRSFNHDMVICGGTHLGYLTHTHKKKSLMDKIEIAYEKRSYQSCKVIVAHSLLLQQELIQFYKVPPEKIVMSYPPINTECLHQRIRHEKIALRKKFNIDPDKITILFPSTGHKRKGFALLIRALKLLPSNQYQLVVAGKKPLYNKLENIRYVGFVREMVELYSACDMTVLPSLYEPFGLVVPESLECGTPVIVSEFVGAKELITEQEGVVLSENTPRAIADAITYVGNNLFEIEPNFAKRHDLTIKSHVLTLKNILNDEKENY